MGASVVVSAARTPHAPPPRDRVCGNFFFFSFCECTDTLLFACDDVDAFEFATSQPNGETENIIFVVIDLSKWPSLLVSLVQLQY